jgi:5'-phosphate synthase pdxT subunit
MRIGVLAAQGAFAEHIATLEKLQVAAIPVRLLQELKGLDGLIIPGGESTSISHLMLAYNLMSEIRKLAKNGFPVFGTCAGMILLARNISDADGITPLGVMDLTVRRNAFGRQVDSFETELKIPVLGEKPFPGIFIRAPLIEQAGSEVEILATLADGNIVAVRQGNLLAAAFHPELTGDSRFHRYFLDIVTDRQ